MNESNKLIRVTEEQIEEAGNILARAFYDYPQYDYLMPDLDERSRKLPEIYEFLVRYGLMYGEVYSTSSNLEGVAVWLPYWEAEMIPERNIRCGARKLASSLGREWYKRFELIEEYEQRCHKQYADFIHWYLYPIGVDPVHQGKGHAGILLRAKLAEMDKLNLPCYLETNKKKNVSLYQHFGFDVVEEGIISDTGVPYWAILRMVRK